MQRQAEKLCDVRLRRIPRTDCNDSLLLLGLIIIIATDKGDTVITLMLLYIFLA